MTLALVNETVSDDTAQPVIASEQPTEVSARRSENIIKSLPKLFTTFFNAHKRIPSKNAALSQELKSNFRIVLIRKQPEAEFAITGIEEKEDGTWDIKISEMTDGILTFYMGSNFGSDYYHKFNDKLSINLAYTNKTISRNSRRYIKIDFIVNLTEEEVQEICAGPKVEEFKIASAMSTLCASHFKEMSPYPDPKSKGRSKKSPVDIVVRQSNGKLLFLPKTDYRLKVERDLIAAYDPETYTFDVTKTELPPVIVYWNMETGVMSYTNSKGVLASTAITGATQLSRRAAYSMLTSSFNDIMVTYGTSGSDAIHQAITEGVMAYGQHSGKDVTTSEGVEFNELHEAMFDALAGSNTPEYMIWHLTNTKIYEAVNGGPETILDLALKWQRGKFGIESIRNPLRRYSVVAVLTLMREYLREIDNIKQEIAARIENMEKATIENMPTFPGNLAMSGLEFWTHQAEAEAKLDIAEESAIIDVSTGGGKTLILLADILNCMRKSVIQKAIGVVPGNLISNWYDEITAFTNGTVNCMVISTETINNWGIDAIIEKIQSAPKNTIFLTTYKWLTLGAISEEIGNRLVYWFPNVNTLKKAAAWDMVFLDESHLIKDPKTLQHNAVIQLGEGVPYKRIATGTLAPNYPKDIVGQVAFIDPTIFGSVKQFEEDYPYNDPSPEEKMRVVSECKEALKSVGLVSYTRKDWFHKLPKIEEDFHIVELTDAQRKVYNAIVTSIMDGVKPGTKEHEQWLEIQSNPDAAIPAWLLPKLHRLNDFPNNPAGDATGDVVLSDVDRVSPKVAKVIELLDAHFAKTPDEKVLIFMQGVDAHNYIFDSLPPIYKSMAIAYRGGEKEKLERFKTDKNVKIMVACDSSLKVGHNLQMASRMIRLDVHWSSGDLDQVLARIYRPSTKYNRDKIHIDWVLADQTADIMKIRRTLRKLALNSAMCGIIEIKDLPLRQLISANEQNILTGSKWDEASQMEIQDYKKFRELESEKWEIIRAEKGVENHAPILGESIGEESFDVPWPFGITIKGEGIVSIKDMLIDFGGIIEESSADDDNGPVDVTTELKAKDKARLNEAMRKLRGHRVITEFGEGTILATTLSKKGYRVKVKIDGETKPRILYGSTVGIKEGEIDDKIASGLDVSVKGVPVEVDGVKCFLAANGIIYKLTKAGKLPKNPYILFSKELNTWITKKGKPVPKSIINEDEDFELRAALKEMGFKFKKPKAPVDAEYISLKFNKTPYALYPNGDIRALKKNKKPGRLVFQVVNGVFVNAGKTVETKKITTAVKAKLAKRLLDKFGVDITTLTQEQPKQPKEPKPESAEPKVKKFKLWKRKLALTDKGKVHPIGKTGKLLKPVLFEKKGQWVNKKKQVVKELSKKRVQWLNEQLGILRGEEVVAPETETKPSIKLEALALYGSPFMDIQYSENDAKLIEKTFKRMRFKPHMFYRLKLTPAKIRLLEASLKKGKLKPSNRKTILNYMEKFRQPRKALKQLKLSEIVKFNRLFERNLINKKFTLLPIVLHDRVELWISAKNPKVLTKHMPEIKRLKFRPVNMLIKIAKTLNVIKNTGDKVADAADKQGIEILNLDEFKEQLTTIKKYL